MPASRIYWRTGSLSGQDTGSSQVGLLDAAGKSESCGERVSAIPLLPSEGISWNLRFWFINTFRSDPKIPRSRPHLPPLSILFSPTFTTLTMFLVSSTFFLFLAGPSKFFSSLHTMSPIFGDPHNEALLALKHFPDIRPNPLASTLLHLAEQFLSLNYFSFAEEFYQLVAAVAKGMRIGSKYEALFIGLFEVQICPCFTGSTKELFGCYIADWIGVTSLSREQ